MSDRCQGITSTGEQCRREGPYCYQHSANPKRRRREIDYDEMIGRVADWITEALGAEASGKWTPTATSMVLRDEVRLMLESRLEARRAE